MGVAACEREFFSGRGDLGGEEATEVLGEVQGVAVLLSVVELVLENEDAGKVPLLARSRLLWEMLRRKKVVRGSNRILLHRGTFRR